jgi:hypothetical protein
MTKIVVAYQAQTLTTHARKHRYTVCTPQFAYHVAAKLRQGVPEQQKAIHGCRRVRARLIDLRAHR